MDRFVHTLVETSGESGYHVLLFSGTPDDPVGGYDDLLRSTAVDAFIVTDTYLGNPQAAWLTSKRAPFVAFGRPWDDPEATYPWVDVDGAAGTELATDHLLDKGHTRIAWIGWRKDSFIGEDRRSGWTRAMHARDLPTTGLASRVEDTVASGREAASVLLDEARPSAFVCASDTLAIGRAAHPRRPRHPLGQGHRGGRLRRLPGRAGRARWARPRCASRSSRWPSSWSRRSRACSPRPPSPAPACCSPRPSPSASARADVARFSAVGDQPCENVGRDVRFVTKP